MKYTIEEISPIQKKITVDLEAVEVNTAIESVLKVYQTEIQLPGFRKGKIPYNVLLQRYRKQMMDGAKEDLVNAYLQQIMEETHTDPIGELDIKPSGEVERDKPFSFVILCEVLPTIDIPNFEGLEVSVKKLQPNPHFLEDALKREQWASRQFVPAKGDGPAVDGQVVNIDYKFILDGKEVKKLSELDVTYHLGYTRAVPGFDECIKKLHSGEEGEEEITFPKDFINQNVAGKTGIVKIKLNSIKDVKLPEIDDEFARKKGFASLESMKEGYLESEKNQLKELEKGTAENALLKKILSLCEFPVPNNLIKVYQNDFAESQKQRMEERGIFVDEDTMEDIRKRYLNQSFERAQATALLLAIAKKEQLTVSDKELQMVIMETARSMHYDYQTLRELYEKNGMIFEIRNRLLCDKAAEIIYARGKVVLTDESEPENAPATPSSEEGAAAPIEGEVKE